MTAIEIISLIASLASLILAVVAISYAYVSSKEVNENFQKTQEYLNNSFEKTKEFLNTNYDKTKDVLSEIDKRAAIIDKTVSESQKNLLNTLTNILNETVIPKKQDLGEQIGLKFMQALLENPGNANQMMDALKPFIEMQQKNEKEK